MRRILPQSARMQLGAAMTADKNSLSEGEHRLGWLTDGSEETPNVSCTITRIHDEIELQLPWLGHDSPFRRWFGSRGTVYGDDPDQTKYRYEPPGVLWFHDLRGCVTLVGCHDNGFTENGMLGQGRVTVDRAVFGGRYGIDYTGINGLRSSIPGLSQWLALRSLRHESMFDETGRLQTLELKLEAPPPIRLHRTLNLSFRPSFGYSIGAHGDTSEITETILLETNTKKRRDWNSHWRLHHEERELVGLSAWRPFNIDGVHAYRADDPERVLSGDAIGDRWAPVHQSKAIKYPEVGRAPQFLFTFGEIGAIGVSRWISLRRMFKRGVLPILDTLGRRDSAIEVQLSQCGIGLDGLGYHLALAAGASISAANSESHKTRLLRVMQDLRVPMPFDTATWAQEGAIAYNAVKHANRQMPTFEDLINVRRRHQLVFRAWVAGRLGMNRELLQSQISRDPMATQHTVIRR